MSAYDPKRTFGRAAYDFQTARLACYDFKHDIQFAGIPVCGDTMFQTDKVFGGSIPENYDRYCVPLIFEDFAQDIAQRVASLSCQKRKFAAHLELLLCKLTLEPHFADHNSLL